MNTFGLNLIVHFFSFSLNMFTFLGGGLNYEIRIVTLYKTKSLNPSLYNKSNTET